MHLQKRADELKDLKRDIIKKGASVDQTLLNYYIKRLEEFESLITLLSIDDKKFREAGGAQILFNDNNINNIYMYFIFILKPHAYCNVCIFFQYPWLYPK